jgi:DNA-binding GntR family transcriptional regulator
METSHDEIEVILFMVEAIKQSKDDKARDLLFSEIINACIRAKRELKND